MAATYKTVIHWFRRDLRLTDNQALWHATQSAEQVIPAYIVSSWRGEHAWTGPGRQHFLCGSLESLARNLAADGDGRLVIRQGKATEALERLIKEAKAEAVFYNRDPDPHGKDVEKSLQAMCRSLGVQCHAYKDAVLHEPDEVLTGSGGPYRVYTPYSKAWFSLPKPDPVPKAKRFKTPPDLTSEPLPTLSTWGLELPGNLEIIDPGERAARHRLKAALTGPLNHYADRRNDPSAESTSRLGPDLRFGTISPREVFLQARAAADNTDSAASRQSLHTFQKQLAWREFFMAILGHFPNVLDEEFNPVWRGLAWDDPGEGGKFDAWCEGRTGFPIVDAGMRQLKATGYMHNRVRMIVAMFLTKDLHLHWRLGEAHFLRHLVDGEIAANNGGWQWSAGTGADAAPYFRIQNPWTQTERYDPEGTYIRQWVPELASVDPKRFQRPPEPLDPIAPDYPLPILDHKIERESTLDRFKRHREAVST